MKHRSVALAAALVLVCGMATLAQEPISSADQVVLDRVKIKRLEDENRVLKAQVILLTKQLADLRGNAPSVAAPAVAEEAGPKTYHHMVELMREMPPELKPKPPDHWSEAQAAKVAAWLKAQAPGRNFAANLRVASVRVDPNPAREQDKDQPKWVATIILTAEAQSFIGTHVSEAVQGVGAIALGVTGGAELLHRFDRLRGAHVDVSGVIDELTVDYLNFDDCHLTVHLRDYKFDFPPPTSAAH